MAQPKRIPLTIDSEWQSKTVTTDAPRYIPHLEWSLVFSLAAAEPIRLAVFIEDSREVSWGVVNRDAATKAQAEVKFFPYDWSRSDAVQVNFEWQRRRVADALLKSDPRQKVATVAPRKAETGDVIPLVALPSHDLTLALVAFAESDTQRRREGRWRLKPELGEALEPYGAVLASGHQNGVIKR
jgi:hypothetical protein